MALKLKLTKDEFNALAKELQSEYIADGDNYVLDVSGLEDTGPLRRALDRAKAEKVEMQSQLEELREKQENIDREAARKNKDIDTLEKQWKRDLDAAVNSEREKLTKAHAFIEKQLGHSVAESLAKELTDSHALLMPHLKSRIKVNTENGDFRTVILDADGNETTGTVEDLAKEFRADKNFSAIMKVSKASGAATQSKPRSGPVDDGGGKQPDSSPGALSMDYRALAKQHADRMKEGDE